MTPSVGRIVHYWDYDANMGEVIPNAALILRVRDALEIDVKVFYQNGVEERHCAVSYASPEGTRSDWRNCWSWPEKI
jgi:hypothetical protein